MTLKTILKTAALISVTLRSGAAFALGGIATATIAPNTISDGGKLHFGP